MKPYKKLFESLRISDLVNNAGVSDLTNKFKKRRGSLIGQESRNTKLIDVEINENKKWVTFVFLTEVTPDVKLYGKDYTYKEVDIENDKVLKVNRSKTYEMRIRFLKFFEWLDTFEGEKITPSHLIEIFDISDIKLSSNDPSFQYQGINYKLSMFDASIYPTDIPDSYWGKKHNDNNLLTKHLQGLLNSIKFYINQMSLMLDKKLKERNLI